MLASLAKPPAKEPAKPRRLKVVETVENTFEADAPAAGSSTHNQGPTPDMPDDDGPQDDFDDVDCRYTLVGTAVAALEVNPELGDPVDLARRMFDFVRNG